MWMCACGTCVCKVIVVDACSYVNLQLDRRENADVRGRVEQFLVHNIRECDV